MNRFNIQNVADYVYKVNEERPSEIKNLLMNDIPVKPPYNSTRFFWRNHHGMENGNASECLFDIISSPDHIEEAKKVYLSAVYEKLKESKKDIFEIWLANVFMREINDLNWFNMGMVVGFLDNRYTIMGNNGPGILDAFVPEEVKKVTKMELNDIKSVMFGQSVIPLLALKFLHCKKVEIIDAPGTNRILRLNKKRSKSRQKLTYKELEITQIVRILNETGKIHKTGWHNALHTCRGHFRHYKNGKTSWIREHEKGQIKFGEVVKDYKEIGKPEIESVIYNG